jgi:hypothetical protein
LKKDVVKNGREIIEELFWNLLWGIKEIRIILSV